MLHVKRRAIRSYALYVAAELRGLAEESLTLLKEFLLDERFPALFDLEVYGSIIGMFELNNLSKPLTRSSCHLGLSSAACSTSVLSLIMLRQKCDLLMQGLPMHCLHGAQKRLVKTARWT